MYYGKDRSSHLDELEKYKLIITTYSVVRLDWKAWLQDPKSRKTLHSIHWFRVVLDEGRLCGLSS